MKKDKYNITELYPESALRVFILIDKIFRFDLNPKAFKTDYDKLNTKEQYYFSIYLEQYLDQTSFNSHFTRWIKFKQHQYSMAGEEAMFYQYEKKIRKNRKHLLQILSQTLKFSTKRYEFLTENKIKGREDYLFLLNRKENFKIPLPVGLKGLKNTFVKSLSNVITEEEAIMFYNNSFDFGKGAFPVKLLFLKPSKKSELRAIMFDIYIHYVNRAKMNIYEMKRAVDNYNMNTTSKYSKKHYSQPYKYDFVRIMYNAFPYVRLNFYKRFIKSLENSKNKEMLNDEYIQMQLENYFRIEARNLKK